MARASVTQVLLPYDRVSFPQLFFPHLWLFADTLLIACLLVKVPPKLVIGSEGGIVGGMIGDDTFVH